MNSVSARTKTTIAALVALSLIPFIRLGSSDLQNDEIIYASRVQEIVVSGNFLPRVPLQVLYGAQPPLAIWAMAGAVKAFGFSSFALRLVPALSSALLFVIMYWLALLVLSPPYALGAAGLLASSPILFRYAQMAQLDMPCVMLVTAAFTMFWYSREFPKRWATVIAGVFLGCAFIAKLLIAALPAAAFLGWFALERLGKHKAGVPVKSAAMFFGVAALVAAPWHIWAAHEYGNEFFSVAIGYNIVERVVTGIRTIHKPTGVFYYANQLVVGFPFGAVVFLFFCRRSIECVRARSLALLSSFELFLWLWFGVPFLALSVMRSQLQSHAVQLLPPLALLAILGIREFERSGSAKSWRTIALSGIILDCLWGLSQSVRDGARMVFSSAAAIAPVSETPFFITVYAALVLLAAILFVARRKRDRIARIFYALPTWGVALLVAVRVADATADSSSIRRTGAPQIAAAIPAGEPVAFLTDTSNDEAPQMSFHCYDATKTLYRRMQIFERRTFARMPVALPDSIHFVIVYTTPPYRSGDGSGAVAESALQKQQYVRVLATPEYDLFARGLARSLLDSSRVRHAR